MVIGKLSIEEKFANRRVSKMTKRHPIQPTELDENGTLRFKKNAIVEYLLDSGDCDMNKLAELPFSREDREQFAQLIGYSLCGASDLSYVTDTTIEAAEKMHEEGLTEEQARLRNAEDLILEIKDTLRPLAARLFCIHEDDLK